MAPSPASWEIRIDTAVLVGGLRDGHPLPVVANGSSASIG